MNRLFFLFFIAVGCLDVFGAIGLEVVDLERGEIKVKGNGVLLEDVVGVWEVKAEGVVLKTGEMPEMSGVEMVVVLPVVEVVAGAEKEVFLNVKTVLGSEQEIVQVKLSDGDREMGLVLNENKTLKLHEDRNQFIISSENTRLIFDRKIGTIKSYSLNDKPLVVGGVLPSVWRAPIDNDKGLVRGWRRAGYSNMKLEVVSTVADNQGDKVLIISMLKLLPRGKKESVDCKMVWTAMPDGSVYLKTDYIIDPEIKDLPRIGLEMKMPVGMDVFSWYGKGPSENYIDTVDDVYVDVFSAGVDDMYVSHAKPQACGNRSGVRWCSLVDESGAGLKVVGDINFNSSASFYSTEDLDMSKSENELKKNNYIRWNFDIVQRPGGDGKGNVDERYLFDWRTVSLMLRFIPVAG